MKDFILGTVQLGIQYGINNHEGKPDIKESHQILDYAFHNYITCLDTAEEYGDSEEIIGRYIKSTGNSFKICTKLSARFDCDQENLSGRLNNKVSDALDRLGVSKIHLYYLHSFHHCKNAKLLDAFMELKNQGLTDMIGVSIYEPSELEYILENCPEVFDVVQLPFNLFDCSRWLKQDLLIRAKQKKIKLYARSILLQGLILKDEKDDFIKKLHAGEYIRYIDSIAAKKDTDRLSLAYSFVKNIDEIQGILVGCETLQQLRSNIELWKQASVLDQGDVEKIKDYFSSIDSQIIDPRKW